ncbi:MAG TPA: hypothetical protein VK892_10865 [Pyrinomonadaceae bacterium]|nr:hypothetical protein [Pyrinomonadaceae bacterium]
MYEGDFISDVLLEIAVGRLARLLSDGQSTGYKMAVELLEKQIPKAS